jgi:hypothetical protein
MHHRKGLHGEHGRDGIEILVPDDDGFAIDLWNRIDLKVDRRLDMDDVRARIGFACA